MKKRFLFFLLLSFLLCGCTFSKKADEVTTIIENHNDVVVAINYPVFHFHILDQAIKKDVDLIYQNFKYLDTSYTTREKAELNISYHTNTVNERYITVVLTTFIQIPGYKRPRYQINTYTFDKWKKRLYTISDFINKEELRKIVPLLRKNLYKQYPEEKTNAKVEQILNTDRSNYHYFTFTDEEFIFYFPPFTFSQTQYSIIKIPLPLDQINLTLPIEPATAKSEVVPTMTLEENVLDPTKPTVAFTFDDGPSRYTEKILKTLGEHHANGTFFVIGNKATIYKKTLKKMVQNGNEIGNHSYNHKWLTRVDDAELLDEINNTQKVIQKVTGFTPKLFRPTYGAINQHLREKISLRITMWTVDTSDWKTKNAKTIAKRTLKSIKDGSIILLHDTHKQSVKALEYMLEELEEKGYQFVTVSELNEILYLRESTKQR